MAAQLNIFENFLFNLYLTNFDIMYLHTSFLCNSSLLLPICCVVNKHVMCK